MRRLVCFISLDAQQRPDGRVVLTHKFIEGMRAQAEGFDGEVVAVFAPSRGTDTNLDHEAVDPATLPFEVVVRAPFSDVDDLIRGASLVTVAADYRHYPVAQAARRLGVPYVITAEYNLRTRLQIAALEEPALARRFKRMAWELSQEVRLSAAAQHAAGLQCNGTPTADALGGLCKNTLVFFDTRVTADMLASDDVIAQRAPGDRPLRLAFSGRLIAMKGVQFIPDIALALKQQHVPFSFAIYGAGQLESQVRDRVRLLGLSDDVQFKGVLPFSRLMTTVRDTVDLFVCPHPQGDPSCTYLETLSCGVPIAGFDNDAWRGVLRHSGGGVAAPVGDSVGLAKAIARLSADRTSLRAYAQAGLRFARQHTFEQTFAARMAQLRQLSRS